MKTVNKSAETNRSFDQLISMLSKNEILSTLSMSFVKGGAADGEGNGNETISIIPKPPVK